MIEYIQNINRLYKTGISTEHSYRGDLQNLLKKLVDENIVITNEPTRIVNVGAPDFSLTKNGIPIGYIEAKDIGKNLDDKVYLEQFSRYINAFDNLIITNYIEFRFYKNHELVKTISIAKIEKKIIPIEKNFEEFKNLIKDFSSYISQTIKSPKKLAYLMANKAKLLKDVLTKILEDETSTLQNQYAIFKQNFIHDLKKEEFADIYAQTIAFGMFIARFHDYTLEDFSVQEARSLIPKSHPFLRGLFKYISDEDEIDDRLKWIIDSLAEVFLAVNIRELFDKKQDPIIYFYEDFLSFYNPNDRKKRGVYYTPKEVVDFIIKSVDLVLKNEFNLDGLIDESKVTTKIDDLDRGFNKNKKRYKKEITTHKVQILDPAVGTGTFLASLVEFIKSNFFGNWQEYVNNDLLPRLNGFELLMAPYAVAHLKLDMVLDCKIEKRVNIFLTNSLEKAHEHHNTLFASYLAEESKKADEIKKNTPIMVIVGNPPYSGISANKNEWIDKLIDEYKYIGNEYFNEKKHWLNDDYVKFIRLAEYYIEKNEEGVIGYITPHGFLDNPTFRGMRYHLLKTFDKIYILNLHGNSRKKETTPDGSKDENIFDIQQGVSINIFIKTSKKASSKVYYYDVWGKRSEKKEFLEKNDINSIKWQEVKPKKPYFFFVPKDYELEGEYNQGFGVNELFLENVTGIVTMGDNFIISKTKEELRDKILNFLENDYTEEELKSKYILGKNYAKWILENKKKIKFDENKITQILYRPFDIRYTYFDNLLIWRCREKVMKHFINKDNVGLITAKSNKSDRINHFFVSNYISEAKTGESTTQSYTFPLYLYNDLNNEKTINFNQKIIQKIEKSLNLVFLKDFNELDLFHYIYAILHHLEYREKYKEFLKVNFPKIPYPKKNFFKLAEYGEKLKNLHLLNFKEDRIIELKGENLEITNKLNKKDIIYLDKRVEIKINPTTSIIIPKIAFEFFIGGYQVALKYLKDRDKLDRKSLTYYNKVIDSLVRSYNLMQEIKNIKW